ncbi:hypothetical protein ACYULU_00665 [Breznakiellaceae bacterium SP9]
MLRIYTAFTIVKPHSSIAKRNNPGRVLGLTALCAGCTFRRSKPVGVLIGKAIRLDSGIYFKLGMTTSGSNFNDAQ